jgi:hypothetical protein
MRLPRFVLRHLKKLSKTVPDEIIGPGIRSRKRDGHVDVPKAFLVRWFVVPKNRFCNIYLHKFIRDDEDRALHDHPWWNLSLPLREGYIEHTIDAGGVHKRTEIRPGTLKLRAPWHAHRVELHKDIACGEPIASWSLFITGPVVRGWGFHCPGEWRSQEQFAKENGCGEDWTSKGYKRND